MRTAEYRARTCPYAARGEQKLPETVVERVENVEENLASLVRLMAVFNGKMDRIAAAFNERMDRASIDEKERLKSLLQLLKSELSNHDQAEQARFERIKPHTF